VKRLARHTDAVRTSIGVISVAGLMTGGYGGKTSPAPVSAQVRDALEHPVASADARAHVDGCTAPLRRAGSPVVHC
jgi:hypothetical protein